ncbi:nucleotidyltransferase family protein [Pseudogemmatithrix spongiicola]|uniref:Nucleotidyltransferase family protein n=1 Tax=Pseudogemmatithrix spongiicola TaxID=3062599 RepID=A0AA49JV62_9BACT|nr:nucleotidyltransferase family protein [Gemmatimonadaceae bacterium 'strain 138']WKW15406.1 nucleotidyltransferase family protein [Gemmatimonadaceae bacterium 'strain 318']
MPTRTLTRRDVQSRIADVEAAIRGFGVQRLALFGSVRRDAATPDSDVDLLVEFAPGEKSLDHLMALAELLERVLGHPVELVTLESLSPYLRPHVLADAVDVVRAA